MSYERDRQTEQNGNNFVDLSNCNVFYSSNHLFSLYVYWWISALFPFKAVQSAWERKFYPKMVFLPKRFLDFLFFWKTENYVHESSKNSNNAINKNVILSRI